MLEEVAVSLRNQPLRRGLIAGFAVTLFGSFLALGCVQGPKGAFNRVWGPESYASKTSKALKGLGKKETAVDEQKEKLAEAKDGKAKPKKDSLAQASGTKEAAKKSGLSNTSKSKKSEIAENDRSRSFLSRLGRNKSTKIDDVEDPFLKDLQKDVAKDRKRTEIAANTRKPAPKGQPKPATAAPAKPGIAFAKGFDTQLSQLKADVAREKALAEVAKKKAEAEAAAMAAAKREVDALLTQARAADKHGEMAQAQKLAKTADELVTSRRIVFTAGEERPEDFLQKLRDKQVALAAQEHAKKLAELAKSAPALTDDDSIELKRAEDVHRSATKVATKTPAAESRTSVGRSNALRPSVGNRAPELPEEIELAERPAPQVQIKVQRVAVSQPLPRQIDNAVETRIVSPATAHVTVSQIPLTRHVAAAPLIHSGVKPQVRETALTRDMIFDSRVVDWRFPLESRKGPAVSDYREVQVSYEEPARGSRPSTGTQQARVTANSGQWRAATEGRVRTNRGTIVNAKGDFASARLSHDAEIESSRVQMSSHTAAGNQFIETAATTDAAPELLPTTGDENGAQAGIDPVTPTAPKTVAGASNGWSFVLGACFAGICALGLALGTRVRVEKPRS